MKSERPDERYKKLEDVEHIGDCKGSCKGYDLWRIVESNSKTDVRVSYVDWRKNLDYHFTDENVPKRKFLKYLDKMFRDIVLGVGNSPNAEVQQTKDGLRMKLRLSMKNVKRRKFKDN